MAPTLPPTSPDFSDRYGAVPPPDPGPDSNAPPTLELGEPHASMLKVALQLMGLPQADLAARAGEGAGAESAAILRRLHDTRQFLESWVDLVDAAQMRLLGAVPGSDEAVSPAAEAKGPGFSLETLAAEWVAAQDSFEADYDRLRLAEQAAQAEYPPLPSTVRDPQNPEFPRDVAELRRMDQALRETGASAASESPYQDAYRAWLQRCAEVDTAFEVPRLEERMDAAARISNHLARAVVDRRPATIGEAAAKYGVMLKYFGDGHGGVDDPTPFRLFLEDLERLAAQEKRRN